jgi:hypothetical protein
MCDHPICMEKLTIADYMWTQSSFSHSHIHWCWEVNCWKGDPIYNSTVRCLAYPKSFLSCDLKILRKFNFLKQRFLFVSPWVNTFVEPDHSILGTVPFFSCSCWGLPRYQAV